MQEESWHQNKDVPEERMVKGSLQSQWLQMRFISSWVQNKAGRAYVAIWKSWTFSVYFISCSQSRRGEELLLSWIASWWNISSQNICRSYLCSFYLCDMVNWYHYCCWKQASSFSSRDSIEFYIGMRRVTSSFTVEI